MTPYNFWFAPLCAALVTNTPTDAAITDIDPTARQEAAVFLGTAHDAHSLNLLWVLSFDIDADVRQSAFDALDERCKSESPSVCGGLFAAFSRDGLIDIAWSARDRLLSIDVDAALARADRAYKLDLLSRLTHLENFPAASLGKVLRLLQYDNDANIRQNAAFLLHQTP